MNSDIRVPIEFLLTPLHVAHDSIGLNVAETLRTLGIEARRLEIPDAYLTTDEISRFTRLLWSQTDDELFGLTMAGLPRGAFRLSALATIHRPDLATALVRMSEAMRVFQGAPRLMIVGGSTTTRVTVLADRSILSPVIPDRWASTAMRMLFEFNLLVHHRFAAWLVGRRLEPVAVYLPHAAPTGRLARVYDDIYGAPVTYGAETAALEFDNSVLTWPVTQTEESLEEYLRQSPGPIFTEQDLGTSVEVMVRRAIERSPRPATRTAGEIAALLSVSEPHLRRLLRQEGTSVGDLRDEVLRSIAVAALERGDSVDDISEALGFSESSAFRRAFKRWTGSTPGTYR